jgi:hypothetical protein
MLHTCVQIFNVTGNLDFFFCCRHCISVRERALFSLPGKGTGPTAVTTTIRHICLSWRVLALVSLEPCSLARLQILNSCLELSNSSDDSHKPHFVLLMPCTPVTTCSLALCPQFVSVCALVLNNSTSLSLGRGQRSSCYQSYYGCV